MKAILCKSLDGPDGLYLEQISEPTAGPGEVIVQVRAAGLNFFDTLITRGRYQFKPELPFSPSGEIAGVVHAIGPNVKSVSVGDRVMAYIGWGGAREQIAVLEEKLIKIPDTVDDKIAAGVSITYGTALHGLIDRAQVQSGESVVVLGASGGAGLAAIEVAKLLDAHVIAAASSDEKLAVCSAHGADVLLNYEKQDLKSALRKLTSGGGADVIYDCVGGDYAEPGMRAMAWGGRYLVVGFASGDIPKLPLNILLLKGCSAIGVFWSDAVKREPKRHRMNMMELLSWIEGGRLKPRIDKVFPLEEAKEALQLFDRRQVKGKIVLEL